jgi:hypothetical protein
VSDSAFQRALKMVSVTAWLTVLMKVSLMALVMELLTA